MHLHEECEAAAGDAFDDPGLPERSASIERPLEDLGAALLQLQRRSWTGKAGVAHVTRDVEPVVIDPDRVAHYGQVGEPLPESRHQVEPAGDLLPDAVDRDASARAAQRPILEYPRARHVARRGGGA